MKAVITIAVFCLVVALTVEGYGDYDEDLARLNRRDEKLTEKRNKYEKTPESVIGAKYCKPVLIACLQEAKDKSGKQMCFGKFMNGCMLKIKNGLKDIENCISSAGSSFEQVQECLTTPFQK